MNVYKIECLELGVVTGYLYCINILICHTRSNNVFIHSRFEYRILFALMRTLLTYKNISDHTITFSLILVFEARIFKNFAPECKFKGKRLISYPKHLANKLDLRLNLKHNNYFEH